MNKDNISSKVNPLAFFQYLISNKGLTHFENEFYKLCDTHSNTECNRQEGYRIIYHHTTESDGYNIIVKDTTIEKEYFIDYLKRTSERQADKSYNFILERIRELVHSNSEYDKYLNFHLNELSILQRKTNQLKIHKMFFTVLINELEIKVNKIRKDISLLNGRKPIPKFNLKKSYFGAENLKNSHLKELYQISIKYDIVDDLEFTEEEFVNFFSSEDPSSDNLKFVFNCNNIFASNYIDKLKQLFKNFSYATISKSESFYSRKGKTLLKQTNLDSMLKQSKKPSDIDRLKKLNSELDNLIKKVEK